MDKRINKKAEIPVTILVIGVFVICSLALLSFFNSAIVTRNSFVGIDLMEEMNFKIERAEFNSSLGISNFYLEKNETYYTPEFGLPWEQQRTLFSVKYLKN